ncbi:hypothetical protein SDC9_80742 [bioreactor metagenome]|uniref:UspA domain-containing protein n=1 Tax=bioreactor metagenome TaxID=1076179 RepID=A0A644YZW8_9ZZZZ
MRIQTIAALTDFSTGAEQALDRAGLLARRHRAHLCLVYGADATDPRFVNPQARLEQRARQLARQHEIKVTTREFDDSDSVAERVLAAAASADLLVIDKRMERDWARPWRGALLGRCLRQSPCPVLVVQQPVSGAQAEDGEADDYARMLVAVDGQPMSRQMVHYAGLLQGDAAVELFHTDEGGAVNDAQVDLRTLQEYRDELQRGGGAERALSMADMDDARRNRVDSHLGTRDVARQLMVQQQHSGADLIVIGARRNHWLDRWALAARATRLATNASCDVLVCGQLPQEREDHINPVMRFDKQKGWPQFRF